MADDGFLHLRVVDQVVDGNGPVFNAGERVEASTSPLWVCLLTVLSFVGGLGLPWKAVLAGMVLTAIGMVAAQRGALALSRAAGDDRPVWPLGTVAVAALAPFWDYTTSGLETGLSFAWIGASCWWVAVRATAATPPRRRAELAGAVLVSLGYTIRPDLALFSLAFGSVLLAARWSAGWRARAGLVAALGAVPVATQIFRMGYYGLLVPNTALAKEASVAQWDPGWRYLTDLFLPYALWVPVGLALVLVAVQAAGDRDRGARLAAAARLAPVVAGLAHLLYITRVGGDFMHARLLLPAVFGLLAPVGVTIGADALRRPRLTRSGVVGTVAAVTAAWALLAAFQLRPTYSGGGDQFTSGDTIEDERRTWQLLTGMEHPIRNDVRVRHLVARSGGAPEDGVVLGAAVDLTDLDLTFVEAPLVTDLPVTAAGVFIQPAYAWGTDVYTIDTGGLAHPVGGHLHGLSGGRMGHQKFMTLPWQLAGFTPAGDVRAEDGEVHLTADELAAAERATTCGQLATYLDGIRDPLTPGRFLRNIVDSVANTTFRVPGDPHEAAAELCDE
jgi:arabinofuranosyltransferase